MWIVPLKNGWGRVYPTHVGFSHKFIDFGLLVGNIAVRMLLDMMRASLPELVQRIAFTEEWLTGVVEKGGEEDAAVAPQRGGHVRLPQHHQSLWT